MRKISVTDKRALDETFTKQFLSIQQVREQLQDYANKFLENFHQDTYLLFDTIRISELCSLSVKGGLGIANLMARRQQQQLRGLVWDDYVGDCDLNLLIRKNEFPPGRTTGEVMAAVAQRIKILLARTISDTAYCSLVKDVETPLPCPGVTPPFSPPCTAAPNCRPCPTCSASFPTR
ncbi:hypothetical protein [Archangium violaceum]|uniref:Uncharacterized protein n=1 Tax=Archangium violaceum Cb vi76 TaxID=1406225 RepID=A0A084T0Y5_9BACT|nr:hypothetical protein [Archangium violaceum]KFA94370.1 hypothetical protein Q664_03520 [Archangium violaceum Cb vi76]